MENINLILCVFQYFAFCYFIYCFFSMKKEISNIIEILEKLTNIITNIIINKNDKILENTNKEKEIHINNDISNHDNELFIISNINFYIKQNKKFKNQKELLMFILKSSKTSLNIKSIIHILCHSHNEIGIKYNSNKHVKTEVYDTKNEKLIRTIKSYMYWLVKKNPNVIRIGTLEFKYIGMI